jgi:hypothetical protein
MGFNFPNTPTVGAQFTPVPGGITYVWDGTVWKISGVSGPAMGLYVGDNPPPAPITPNQMWLESDTGRLFVYYGDPDSSQWIQVSASPQTVVPLISMDFVQGMTMVPNGTTAVDIAKGIAFGNSQFVTVNAITAKSLASTFGIGSNAGGLDTGVKQVSKTYFTHAIRRQSDGLGDVLFSLSPSAPTLPSGWDLIQRTAAIKTDSSGNIINFIQTANRMTVTSILELNTSAGLTTALRVMSILPLGILTRARLSGACNASASSTIQLFVYGYAKTSGMGTDLYAYVTTTASGFNYGQIGPVDVEANTLGQVQVGVGIPGGSGVAYVYSYGWEDYTVPRIGA